MRTDITRQNEEVVVCETSIGLGIDELLCAQAIFLFIIVLEHLESALVIDDLHALGDGRNRSVFVKAVDVRHFLLKM